MDLVDFETRVFSDIKFCENCGRKLNVIYAAKDRYTNEPKFNEKTGKLIYFKRLVCPKASDSIFALFFGRYHTDFNVKELSGDEVHQEIKEFTDGI